jgi:hypothetical protein
MKVRALALGYYGEARRRPGDVFTLADPSHWSPIWMQVVPDTEPERVTTAQQALDAKLADLSPFGGVHRHPQPADEPGHALHDFDPYASEE